MKKQSACLAMLLATVFAPPALGESIYRCGNSYSQKPCAGGTVVQAEDARSASQGSQTSQAAQRDARTADAMEKARLKEEARPAQVHITPQRVQAGGPGETAPLAAGKPKKPEAFTAVAPGKPGEKAVKKTKKKAKKIQS